MSTTADPIRFDLTRRGFLGAAGGLLIGLVLPARDADAQKELIGNPDRRTPAPAHRPNAYIHIGSDESVTFYVTKSEMGQGPTTACSQLLAEELECDWSKVRVDFAPVDPALYGHQGTVGSQAVRSTWEPLRRAGAEAREMLLQAAANQWGVARSQCRAENGFVINTATSARLSYGSLAEAAGKLPVPDSVTLKDPSQFKIVGKPVKRLDTVAKVTGKAQFGLDARQPGMLYASLERCPVLGGKVASFDATKAKAVPGVKDVIQTPRGVAVIAENTWAALQGRKALTVKFDEGEGASVSTATIGATFTKRLSETGAQVKKSGDVEAGLAKAAKKLTATYEVPYLAHAMMEPLNCTVHAREDGAEVWASTQSPTSTRNVVAQELGLPVEKVNVHSLFMGGGFGRRGEGELDWVLEAAQIAKHFRVPVKLTNSREDDMQHDYYRPGAQTAFTGGVDADGWPSALRASIACPSFGMMRDGVDGTAVNGLSNLSYEIPDLYIDYRDVNTIVPVAYWRAPGTSQNNYFAECFFDELCALGGKDPVEARRRLLGRTPRLLNVLNIAAEKSGWGTKLPAGHFRGVSVGINVGAYVAIVAEVSIAAGKARVHRVVCAVDFGSIVNPAILKQQMEGGIVFGLTAAFKGEITFEKGRAVQSNFHNYMMNRIDETPLIETFIVPSTEAPSGAGEVTNPSVVPSVVNAIFAATKKPIRKLPIDRVSLA